MSTEQVGAYILLLCKSWREKPPGSLPDNDSLLARWARMPLDHWLEIRPGVLAPFTFGTDSRWHQKRQRAEYDKLMAHRKLKVKAAKARWDKPLDAHALQVECFPIPSPIPRSTKPKTIAQKSSDLPGFTLFWEAYPTGRKVGRPAALRAWLSKVRDDSRWPEVIAGLEAWKQSEQWQEVQLIPYPATFLNQMRWQDEAPKPGATKNEQRINRTIEAAKRVMESRGEVGELIGGALPRGSIGAGNPNLLRIAPK